MLLSRESEVNIGVASGLFVGASPLRVAIIVGPRSGQSIQLSTNNPVVINRGILSVDTTNYQFVLDYARYGSAVQMPWFAIGNAAFPINIMEVVCSDEASFREYTRGPA